MTLALRRDAADEGLPLMTFLSVALHGLAFAAWVVAHRPGAAGPARVISGVDLIIPVRRAAPAAAARPKPINTWSFLKMALPALPRAAAPLEVKAPAPPKRLLIEAPKALGADRGRLKAAAALDEALDLGRRRAGPMALAAARVEARRAAALAQAPRLEEVGRRKASKATVELAALAEERRGRLAAPQALETAAPEPSARPRIAAPVELPDEARSPGPGVLSKAAEIVATDVFPPAPAERGPLAAPKRVAQVQAPALSERKAEAIAAPRKKAVEIEGPLSRRRVLHAELPAFPAWAAAKGLVEAETRVLFYVDAAGDVNPNLRVEQTSGYGELDRAAMDALKKWRFEARPGSTGSQWGIITFRFLLE